MNELYGRPSVGAPLGIGVLIARGGAPTEERPYSSFIGGS